MSIAVVTKGPVATAGSILILAKIIGTIDPDNAASVIEQTTAIPTDKARSNVL